MARFQQTLWKMNTETLPQVDSDSHVEVRRKTDRRAF